MKDIEQIYDEHLNMPTHEIKLEDEHININDRVIELINNNALSDFDKAEKIIEVVKYYYGVNCDF